MSDDIVRDTARALRADRVYGATELALRAVEFAEDLLAAHPERDVQQVARELVMARPSMAAIGNAVALILAPVAAGTVDRKTLPEDAEALRQQ